MKHRTIARQVLNIAIMIIDCIDRESYETEKVVEQQIMTDITQNLYQFSSVRNVHYFLHDNRNFLLLKVAKRLGMPERGCFIASYPPRFLCLKDNHQLDWLKLSSTEQSLAVPPLGKIQEHHSFGLHLWMWSSQYIFTTFTEIWANERAQSILKEYRKTYQISESNLKIVESLFQRIRGESL